MGILPHVKKLIMESAIFLKSESMEQRPLWGNLLLLIAWVLDINVWLSHIGHAITTMLLVVAGATTIMAAFNQWKVFQKNYKSNWVVVKIEYVFTYIGLKKNRHRSKSGPHTKETKP